MNCSNCSLQKIKNANYCYGCGIRFIPTPAEPTIRLSVDDLERIVKEAKRNAAMNNNLKAKTISISEKELDELVRISKKEQAFKSVNISNHISNTHSFTETISKNNKILPKGKIVYIPDYPPCIAIICKHLNGDSYSLEYDQYRNYHPSIGINSRRDIIVHDYCAELGKDIFLSRLEAEYVYMERMAKNKREREQRIEYEKTARSRPEFIKEPDPICNACGLPIGLYGHCGCS